MSTLWFLLFCLGLLAALSWLLGYYRGVSSLAALRGDVERQHRESSRYGRVLYPLFVATLIGAGAAFVGLMERSVRDAAGWTLALGPLILLIHFLPRRSRQ